jgi:hypothetical protein
MVSRRSATHCRGSVQGYTLRRLSLQRRRTPSPRPPPASRVPGPVRWDRGTGLSPSRQCAGLAALNEVARCPRPCEFRPRRTIDPVGQPGWRSTPSGSQLSPGGLLARHRVLAEPSAHRHRSRWRGDDRDSRNRPPMGRWDVDGETSDPRGGDLAEHPKEFSRPEFDDREVLARRVHFADVSRVQRSSR